MKRTGCMVTLLAAAAFRVVSTIAAPRVAPSTHARVITAKKGATP